MVEYVGPSAAPTAPPVEPPVPPAAGAAESSYTQSTPSTEPARTSQMRTRFRINRAERIWDIVCTVAWIGIAVSWSNILDVLDRVGFPHEIPIPSLELITRYYPWIVNVALVSIAVSVLKIIVGRWTLPVGLAHTVYQSLNGMLTVAMLNSGVIFRPETLQRWVDISKTTTLAELNALINTWGMIIGVIVTIAILIDIIARWVDVARCSTEPAE